MLTPKGILDQAYMNNEELRVSSLSKNNQISNKDGFERSSDSDKQN